MLRALCATGLMVISLVQTAPAQDTPAGLVPGRRVRIHQKNVKPLVGNLISIGPDTVTLQVSEVDTVGVPRASITRFDLYEGTKSGAGKGALTGLLVGVAAGALIGVASSGSDDDSWFDYSASEWALSGAVTFGLIGTGVGALIGSGKRLPRWQATVLPTTTLKPDGSTGSGVAVGMRLRF